MVLVRNTSNNDRRFTTFLRTEDRTCAYNNVWDFLGVLEECKRKKIPPQKISSAIRKLSRKQVPVDRVGGALAIVFKLF